MKKIVLISCVSKKLDVKAQACELYISPLFRLNWAYANQLAPDAIFVLSAKYGLIQPSQEIEPYDMTLNAMSSRDKKKWAERVLAQLSQRVDIKQDHFIFLAGQNYRRYLVPALSSYEIPMNGLSIGKQLQYLMRHVHE